MISRSMRFVMVVAALLTAAAASALAQAQEPSEISRLFAEHHVKQNVVKPPKGILKHQYLVPAGPYFQLFDWDMYFMSVALSYDHVGEPVENSVLDFLEFVDEYANWPGYAPREIAPDALWALPEMCKPFLAQAALRASLTSGDFNWLLAPNGESKETAYAKLARTIEFWENTRRAPDGFFRWYNGVESGVDNNPAVFDVPADVTEGVDLQCYLDREYRALAVIARKLGKAADTEADERKAQALEQAVRTKMWSEPDGMFFNIDSRTGSMIRIKTWTNFVPLWAGIATQAQADRTIKEHLLNPKEFWSVNGVRTLAADEPLYNPKSGYWRGPVWVISNYLVMHGLMNYGYKEQAQELARKTVQLLVADFKASGGMNENYAPETGAPAAGGNFVSWNLLAEHMVEEARDGSDPAAIGPLNKPTAPGGNSFTIEEQCGRPTSEYTIPVADHPAHLFRIEQTNCTPSTPLSIGGVAVQAHQVTGFSEIDGKGEDRWFHVFVMANGDQIFARSQGTASFEGVRFRSSTAQWTFTGGTEKFQKLSGGGTYSCHPATGGFACDAEGTYTLPPA